jgi:hypothetical protein
MSAVLYEITVVANENDRLTLRVTDTYGQEWALIPSRSLALQFLWEPWHDIESRLKMMLTDYEYGIADHDMAKEAEDAFRRAPIGREFLKNDCNIFDRDWVRENVGRFIRDVQVVDRVREGKEHMYGPRSERPQATYIIHTTDPKWLRHLEVGMVWESPAYDMDDWPKLTDAEFRKLFGMAEPK